ncbi:MAG: AbrB/MazE/SpoVT family DNA-binding domain-containing protein [Dehalococcoidales bacterium]|nr:AbrB/MazE/SpoVT family DNA-binding domain-containing protein [Dehalococcoidales bacterium]
MANKVGSKGQVVIDKELRDQLGIKPGWIALQQISGDHIELYFIPPEHKQSLKGSLAGHIKMRVKPGKDWDKARETAWDKAAQEKMTSQEKAA